MEKKNPNVKLHIFIPSGKKIWTIIGNNEYWLDISMKYCSCRFFYYKSLLNEKNCSHLEKLSLAIKQHEFEEIRFNDQEYNIFVGSLLKDILNQNF